MTLFTNKQADQELREIFKLDIPTSNGNIYHTGTGVQIGFADSFSGLHLSSKAVCPVAVDEITGVSVWNPNEETNFEVDQLIKAKRLLDSRPNGGMLGLETIVD